MRGNSAIALAPGPGAPNSKSVKRGSSTPSAAASARRFCDSPTTAYLVVPYAVVNGVGHPDAVFDTALWTDEVLETSARRYGLTVDEYKTRNVLSAEVTSVDVALATVALVDGTLSKTTGAPDWPLSPPRR